MVWHAELLRQFAFTFPCGVLIEVWGRACSDGDFHWMVPVNVCTASCPDKPKQTFLLKDKTAELTVKDVKAGEWVKVCLVPLRKYCCRDMN